MPPVKPGPSSATTPSDAPLPSRATTSRRRGKVLEQAILESVVDQLRSAGYESLTMDKVAAAAGTGKAALYRRWANRDDLVADALASALPDATELRPTGDVRADLLTLLRCLRDTVALTQSALFQTVRSEAAGAGGMIHAVVEKRVFEPCQEQLHALLAANTQGRAALTEAELQAVAGVGPAMILQHAMSVEPFVPDERLESIADHLILPLIRR